MKKRPDNRPVVEMVQYIPTLELWEKLSAIPDSRITNIGEGRMQQFVAHGPFGETVVYARDTNRKPCLQAALCLWLASGGSAILWNGYSYSAKIKDHQGEGKTVEEAILRACLLSLTNPDEGDSPGAD